MLKVINPSNGNIIKEYQEFAESQIEVTLANCQESFLAWRKVPFKQKLPYLIKLADLLTLHKDQLAHQMTEEMGKPITQAVKEVEKCVAACQFYAEQGENLLKEEKLKVGSLDVAVLIQPLGIVFGIMPWNFPLWQIFRFALACFLVGNGVLIKHAPNVTGIALMLEKLIGQVLPKNLFCLLLIHTDRVERVIADSRIAAVTLTGSEQAGAAVASLAGRYLKKSVLELGGSDAFIVLKEASLDACIDAAINARLINSGQSCIAAKRFIVAKEIYEPFITGLLKLIKEVKVGNPLDTTTQVGPLARLDLLDKLDKQVQDSIALGANCLYGGFRLPFPGFYYNPTLLTEVKKGMPAYHEETFGPVFAVMKADSAEEAIQMANDTCYGLGASIWSQDIDAAQKGALQLEAGSVFINEAVASDVRVPFGGVKRSGYGRELSHFGIKEFANVKAVTTRIQK